MEERINGYLSQYEKQVGILDSVPGIDVITASVIISEVGVDISQFPTAGHLASWAGLCPGNNESAGKSSGGAIAGAVVAPHDMAAATVYAHI